MNIDNEENINELVDELREKYNYKSGHSKYSIRPNTALNIFRAVDYAKYIGTPLNNFVTITFAGKCQIAGRYVFHKIRESINRWLKRISSKEGQVIPPTWVFVFENPNDHFHVHWLIHIPNRHIDTFRKKVEKLLVRHQGCPLQANQLDFQDVNPYEDKTLANYLNKGIRPDAINFFHLGPRAAYQGYIVGQRARVSKNLGPKVIKLSGFNASFQRHEWIKLHPHIAGSYRKPSNWNLGEVIPQKLKTKSFPGFREYWTELKQKDYSFGRRRNLKKDPFQQMMTTQYKQRTSTFQRSYKHWLKREYLARRRISEAISQSSKSKSLQRETSSNATKLILNNQSLE